MALWGVAVSPHMLLLKICVWCNDRAGRWSGVHEKIDSWLFRHLHCRCAKGEHDEPPGPTAVGVVEQQKHLHKGVP